MLLFVHVCIHKQTLLLSYDIGHRTVQTNRKQKTNSRMEKLDWSKPAILLLIKKWKQHECLYNRCHKHYKSIQARQDVLTTIAEELSETLPNVTISDIKNKIHYLRGQYTRELAKRRETDGAYKPSAFWFFKLNFLEEHIQTRSLARTNDDVLSTLKNELSEDNWVKKPRMEENICANNDTTSSFDMSLQPKVELDIQNESIAISPHSGNEYPPEAFINEDDSYVHTNPEATIQNGSFMGSRYSNHRYSHAPPERRVFSQAESFAEFLKVEFARITDQTIYDEMMENIMKCLFDAKKKQQFANRLD